MEFYHGTTDILNIDTILLPPCTTKIFREQFRKKFVDKVFFTNSLLSAQQYAKKAVIKYGGNPIVYIIKPIGEYFNTVNNEYITDAAFVISKLTINERSNLK